MRASFLALRKCLVHTQKWVFVSDFGFRVSDFFRPLAALARERSGSAFGFRISGSEWFLPKPHEKFTSPG